jgi:putative Holliday junction resolvase
VAVTDPLGIMAQPLATLSMDDPERFFGALRDIIVEKDVTRIVVGLPVNMDGSHGPAAKAASDFAARVGERTGLPVETWDERLTSSDADSRLAESGMHWKKRKERVDQVAAALILKAWLEKQGGGRT